MSGWGNKGRDYGEGRWTQTQLKRRQDEEKNKRRALLKSWLQKPKADKQGQKAKEQSKIQSSNQSQSIIKQGKKCKKIQNIPNREQEHEQHKTNQDNTQTKYTDTNDKTRNR